MSSAINFCDGLSAGITTKQQEALLQCLPSQSVSVVVDLNNPSDQQCEVGWCILNALGEETCPHLEDILNQVCVSKLLQEVWGIVLLLVFVLVVVICITVFKERPLGGLMKKNLLIRRNKACKSFCSQICEVIIVAILVVVVLGITGTQTEVLDVGQEPFELQIVYLVPDSNRRTFLHVMSPFGGLLYLIVFTYPIAATVIGFVQEKESRIKENLRIAGMKDLDFAVSWILTLLFKYTPLCLIVTVLSKYGGLFPNQTNSEIFFFFFTFVFFNIGVSNLVSAFIHGSTRIAAITNVVIAFLGYLLLYTDLGSDTTADQKLGYCFIPTTCLAFGVNYMFSSTATAIGVDLIPVSGITFPIPRPNWCSLLMTIWGLTYYVLGWYLEHILPQKYGTRRHPLFPFRAVSRWCRTLQCCPKAANSGSKDVEMNDQGKGDLVVAGLNKVFRVRGLEGGTRVAVSDLNLTVPAGEILVLLGSNGAGKSTTFNMLTGMTVPTSGVITIFGHSMKLSKEKIRSFMGYVPQTTISYEQLTIKQNLQLISRLQGVSFNLCTHEPLLTDLDILKQLNVRAHDLSGGQRRKLDLCMALVGDPKVLFLDEVSTGVDPSSRKEIWKVLRKQRHNKVIICTTHFLDEAEQLGDKIAILDRGKLMCYGSPLELKSVHGGNVYTLSVFAFSGIKARREGIGKTVLTLFPSATSVPTHSSNVVSFNVPMDPQKTQLYCQLLEQLERMDGSFSINLELPSLEDVFLRVIRDARASADKQGNITDKQQRGGRRGFNLNKVAFSRCRIFQAMLLKRKMLTKHNTALWAALFLVSLLFALLPILMGEISVAQFLITDVPSTDPVVTCDPTLASNASLCCDFRDYQSAADPAWLSCMKTRPQCLFSDQDKSSVELSCLSRFAYDGPSLQQKCCDFTSSKSTIYTCQSAYFLFYEAGSASLLEPNSDAYLNEGCLSETLFEQQAYTNALIHSIVLLLGLSFATVPFVSAVVRETEPIAETKYTQQLAGVNMSAYWGANLVWDGSFYFIVGLLSSVCYAFYPQPMPQIASTVVWNGVALILVFVVVMVPVAHSVSFHFKDHSKAFIFVIVFNLVCGAALTVINSLLVQVTFHIGSVTSREVAGYVDYVLNFLPAYALSFGLVLVQLSFYTGHFNVDYVDVDLEAYNAAARADLVKRIAYMIGVGLTAVLYIWIREYCFMRKRHQCKKRITVDQEKSTLVDTKTLKQESTRMDAYDNTDKLQVRALSKVYAGQEHFALLDVSFGVKAGEVLGYIGANGAGKSTTLNLISGRTGATAGQVLLNRTILTPKNAALMRRDLGYCTQTDSLFPELSVFEHLLLFAMIHGHENPEEVALKFVDMIQLGDYSNVRSEQLSGGNKRKLMIALTLLGKGAVVVLDEPSSGMDPMAQRFLWDTILSAKQESDASFLLTSHSFEEVQALCDRVAILIEGQMRYIGTIPELTKRYGTTYQVALKLEKGKSSKDCHETLRTLFKENTIARVDCREEELLLDIAKDAMLQSSVFKQLLTVSEVAGIRLISISDTSLDDVFDLWVRSSVQERQAAYGDKLSLEILRRALAEDGPVDADLTLSTA